MDTAAAEGSGLWSDFDCAVSFFLSVRVSCFSLGFGACSMSELVILLVWVS